MAGRPPRVRAVWVRAVRRASALLNISAVCVLLLGAAAASAAARQYAPLDRPGPRLSVAAHKLRSAVSCTHGISGDRRNPILLVPGTDLTPRSNYSWNYERAFARRHWAYCAVALPASATGDIQVAGEYVVYAIRRLRRESGRRVDILGYSQGGMVPRWALRFWPDTRRMVKAYVALDPSNHGTVDANAACQQQCSAADWQQAAGSQFIRALNSYTETFAGIDYTVIYSRTDEIVVPNFTSQGSSSLHTGHGRILDVAVQQICPNDVSDHLAMGSYDPVGYALAVDAFKHEGLADPKHVPPTVCGQPFQPGVDSATFASHYATFLEQIGRAQEGARQLKAEPPLKCYVLAACARSRGR